MNRYETSKKWFFKGCLFGLFILICSEAAAFYPLDKTYWRSSNFGEYRRPTYLHDGTDISAPNHTPVKAIKDGEICDINNDETKDYGIYVIIKHTDGTYSRYCHLSNDPNFKVPARTIYKNASISTGQLIGYTGKTGTDSYHLHFEYWNSSGQKIDPITGTSIIDGLDQPNNGDAHIYNGVRYRQGQQLDETTNGVYIVTPGDDKKFDGVEDDAWYGMAGSQSITIPLWKDGDPVRIVVEAYDKIIDDSGKEKEEMTTVPNKIYFKITDASGNIVKDKWRNQS